MPETVAPPGSLIDALPTAKARKFIPLAVCSSREPLASMVTLEKMIGCCRGAHEVVSVVNDVGHHEDAAGG